MAKRRRAGRAPQDSHGGHVIVITKVIQQRRESRQLIDQFLDRSRVAAADGDIALEEQAISEAFEFAALADDALGGGMTRYLRKRLGEAIDEGTLRRSEFLGYAGDVLMFADRIIVTGGAIHLMDQHVRASVESAGQLVSSSRPTLTRMAVGSVIPGSALIVGMALPKTTTRDTRSLYFVIEHPDWIHTVQLDPALTDEAVMRLVVAAVNRAAEALAPPTGSDISDRLDQLARLGELRDAGVLTADEFVAEKARILNQP